MKLLQITVTKQEMRSQKAVFLNFAFFYLAHFWMWWLIYE